MPSLKMIEGALGNKGT